MFTIGYKGSNAIVDKKLRAKYGRLNTIQLYEQGLLKAAAASAIYALENGEHVDFEELTKRFHEDFNEKLDEDKLRRLYGISRDKGDAVIDI
ncbi:MAG: hypothetical protein ACR2PY_08695 [Salinispira sp.]